MDTALQDHCQLKKQKKKQSTQSLQKNTMTYNWYAQQLGISLSTAKLKGKDFLMHMLKQKDSKETMTGLKETMSGLKKKDKNLDSNVFFDLNENKVNEETRKIGIDLLNKTLKNLSAIVDEDKEMPTHQRASMLMSISKMILNVR